MSKNKDIPVLDFDKLVDYIVKNTNYDKTVVHRVLYLETQYMMQLGIIAEY